MSFYKILNQEQLTTKHTAQKETGVEPHDSSSASLSVCVPVTEARGSRALILALHLWLFVFRWQSHVEAWP